MRWGTLQALAATLVAGVVLAAACAERPPSAEAGAAAEPPAASLETEGEPPDPDRWTRVLGMAPEAADLTARTGSDNRMHILWTAPDGAGRSLLHAVLDGGGRPTLIDTIARGWRTFASPRLEPAGSALTAVFTGDSAGSGVAQVFVHALDAGAPTRAPGLSGVDPGTGRWALMAGCCGEDAALGFDGDGSVVLASRGSGDVLRTITALPADDATFEVPESAPAATMPGGRGFAVTGLPAGGVYVVYCAGVADCDVIRAWRHGALPNEPSVPIAVVDGARLVAAGAAAGGRLWSAWAGQDSLHAARSRVEDGVLAGGAPNGVALPDGAGELFSLAVAPVGEGAELLLVARHRGSLVLWKRRVLPALSVEPPAMPPPLEQDAVLRLFVTDAGEPVAGARVRALGTEARSDARGVVELPLAAGVRTDTLRLVVEARGYAPLHLVFHGARPEGEPR
ncbi:MAG TPA: carboxypeptidase-like regulatory domain-containing protein [Longimicrobiales bacterium]|nr:carboxypeptidase-like regulatory domain-containing protein [Longimicrobiales bacterium]